jgi:hypothetical protein
LIIIFLKSYIYTLDPLSEIPMLTLNTVLVSETDMKYFRAFLVNTSIEDAELISQWQHINRSLVQIEELKAKAYGSQGISGLSATNDATPYSLRSKRGKGGRFFDRRLPTSSSMHKMSQMPLEDAAWSLGCLLSSAKEIRALLGDMTAPSWVTNKQTVDLLVLLERTDLVDETSFSSVIGLDPVFIHDVVLMLESIFRVNISRNILFLHSSFIFP